MLLAWLLPLKVIILLGSEGIPRYFPASLMEIDRDSLIIGLSAATVSFYALHLLAERVVNKTTTSATNRLLARSQKMVLFEGQSEMAANAYQRYSRALAGAAFIVAASALLVTLYPTAATVLAVYGVGSLALIRVLHGFSRSFREKVESRPGATVNLLGGIGFFLVFASIVSDFIFWSPPGLLIGIVALLLTRQTISRLTGIVTDIDGLQRQRLKLDALFFHGRVLLPERKDDARSIWPLVRHERRDEWVRPLLEEVCGQEPAHPRYQWLQLGTPNVASFGVWDDSAGNQGNLIKLYQGNRSALALHEASLLMERPEYLPAPVLVEATYIQRFHAHVYELPQGSPLPRRQVKKASERVGTALLAATPPLVLVRRYERSRPMLWQRLSVSTLDWLRVAADSEEARQSIDELVNRVGQVQRMLQNLPLVIVNTEINLDTLWIPDGNDAQPLVLSWGNWTMEPVGAGWPVQVNALKRLTDGLSTAAAHRPALRDVDPVHAELSALCFMLEKHCARQRFLYAMELLPGILERVDAVEQSSDSGSVDWASG
jgi:hypothetical protein